MEYTVIEFVQSTVLACGARHPQARTWSVVRSSGDRGGAHVAMCPSGARRLRDEGRRRWLTCRGSLRVREGVSLHG